MLFNNINYVSKKSDKVWFFFNYCFEKCLSFIILNYDEPLFAEL